MPKIACIQMNSSNNINENLEYAENAIRIAAQNGAVFVATPENTDDMTADRAKKLQSAHPPESHPAHHKFASLANELNITILIGSVVVRDGNDKLRNRSLLFTSQGLIAQYDKIHLFDVDLPNGECRRESDIVNAGNKLVNADIGFANLGLSICYDVRFPHLYRQLAINGANILAVPAAFTVPTGEMHWEVLLRARAIENGAFVIAPAQCGTPDGGRKTYGHSMIIDPWGKIIAVAGDAPTIIYTDIDMGEVARFRQSIPSLINNIVIN